MGDVRFCGILMIWLVLYNDSFSGLILAFTKGSAKGQLGSRSNTAKQEFFLVANKLLDNLKGKFNYNFEYSSLFPVRLSRMQVFLTV